MRVACPAFLPSPLDRVRPRPCPLRQPPSASPAFLCRSSSNAGRRHRHLRRHLYGRRMTPLENWNMFFAITGRLAILRILTLIIRVARLLLARSVIGLWGGGLAAVLIGCRTAVSRIFLPRLVAFRSTPWLPALLLGLLPPGLLPPLLEPGCSPWPGLGFSPPLDCPPPSCCCFSCGLAFDPWPPPWELPDSFAGFFSGFSPPGMSWPPEDSFPEGLFFCSDFGLLAATCFSSPGPLPPGCGFSVFCESLPPAA